MFEFNTLYKSTLELNKIQINTNNCRCNKKSLFWTLDRRQHSS